MPGLTEDEVQYRLDLVHGGRVKLVPGTYKNSHAKARFIDEEFGEWESSFHSLEKGSVHPTRVIEKKRQTSLRNWGVDNPAKSEIIKTKIKIRNLEKYGYESHHQSPLIKQQKIQTCRKNWGVDNPFQSPIVKERMKETSLENFGVPYPAQNLKILSRINKKRRNSRVLVHWKTNEQLICVGSYEHRFVEWCNANSIDFDWQIPFNVPEHAIEGNRVYIVDAYIKSGEHANKWIEIKGWMKPGSIGERKWSWFHSEHPDNSELWTRDVLERHGILTKNRRSPVNNHGCDLQ